MKPAKPKPKKRAPVASPTPPPGGPVSGLIDPSPSARTPAKEGDAPPDSTPPPDWSALCEQAKELIQRLECAFFTGSDLTAVMKLQELAAFATQTLHDCWWKDTTVPHHKWIHEVEGRTFAPRDARREIMKHAVTMEPFPILHYWPSSDGAPLMEREKEAQSDMLSKLARSELKTPGNKDNFKAPLVAEFLEDLHAHFANPFVRPDSWPAGSLERRMWECLDHEPRTKEEVKNWADIAAECLIQKAESHDKLLTELENGTLSSPPNVDMRKRLKGGRLKPDGDLYKVAAPLKYAEKARQKRWATYKRLRAAVSGYSTEAEDHLRKARLDRKHRDASKTKVTVAHIREGLKAAFVDYFQGKISPMKT